MAQGGDKRKGTDYNREGTDCNRGRHGLQIRASGLVRLHTELSIAKSAPAELQPRRHGLQPRRHGLQIRASGSAPTESSDFGLPTSDILDRNNIY